MKEAPELGKLLYHLLDRGVLNPLDLHWASNRCAELLGLTEPPRPIKSEYLEPYLLLEPLAERAANEGLCEKAGWAKEQFISRILGQLTPSPSQTNELFWRNYNESPQKATDALFQAQGDVGYVRRDRIGKNRQWRAETSFGPMDITVNLSKPEKDPASISAAAREPVSGYPPCVICPQNEGFSGNAAKPPRHCLRTVHVPLTDEEWQLQFSPYGYFDQHCILLSPDHKPMEITEKTFQRLFDFVDLFPHYFMGSNAALPLVGGSILSHDHYQGGFACFPMDGAAELGGWSCPEGVKAVLLDWPMTVIRLWSNNKEKIIREGYRLHLLWSEYSDEECQIIAFDEKGPHNTVSLVARKINEQYRLDVVLRNNRVTEDRPFGLFCPQEYVHSVKKENIGLIEVMGLAILPPRVLELMGQANEWLINGSYEDTLESSLKSLLKLRVTDKDKTEYETIIQSVIGELFAQGLSHCGVYPKGLSNPGFSKLLAYLNYH